MCPLTDVMVIWNIFRLSLSPIWFIKTLWCLMKGSERFWRVAVEQQRRQGQCGWPSEKILRTTVPLERRNGASHWRTHLTGGVMQMGGQEVWRSWLVISACRSSGVIWKIGFGRCRFFLFSWGILTFNTCDVGYEKAERRGRINRLPLCEHCRLQS